MTTSLLKFDTVPGKDDLASDQVNAFFDQLRSNHGACDLYPQLYNLLDDLTLNDVDFRGELLEHNDAGVVWYEAKIITDNNITTTFHTRDKF